MKTIIKKMVLSQFLITITCTCYGMEKEIKYNIEFIQKDKEILATAERETKTNFGPDFKRFTKIVLSKLLGELHYFIYEKTRDEDSSTGATLITKYLSLIEIKKFGEKEEDENEIEKILKTKRTQKAIQKITNRSKKLV